MAGFVPRSVHGVPSYSSINGRASIGVNPKTTTSLPPFAFFSLFLSLFLSSRLLVRTWIFPLARYPFQMETRVRTCKRANERASPAVLHESFIARILLETFSDCSRARYTPRFATRPRANTNFARYELGVYALSIARFPPNLGARIWWYERCMRYGRAFFLLLSVRDNWEFKPAS